MSECDLLVVGSANLDLVFECPELPTPGQTLMGTSFATHPGGKGANQAVAAAMLGGKVAFAACLGADSNGDTLLASLEQAGVLTATVERVENLSSGTAGIFVGSDGANMIIVAPGANEALDAERVGTVIALWRPRVVLAQLEVPLEAVTAAATHEQFVLNPAPARPIPDDLLSRCTLLTPNEHELALLTDGAGDRLDSCKMLLDRGAQNIVVTLGQEGCLWVAPGVAEPFPPRSVKALDTTAAGDAFSGAIALFLAQGEPMEAAIRKATAVAALSVTKRGAQDSMPSLAELQDFAPDLF